MVTEPPGDDHGDMSLPRTILSWSIEHSVTPLLVWVAGAVVLERVIARMQRRRLDDGAGTSIVAGIGYIAAKGVVSKLVMFAVAMWVYDHHRLFELDPLDPMVWLTVLLVRDLVYYWIHRAEQMSGSSPRRCTGCTTDRTLATSTRTSGRCSRCGIGASAPTSPNRNRSATA